MKQFLIVLTVMFIAGSSSGQTAEDSVKTAINKMFACMKAADADGLKQCFGDSMVLQTIAATREGKTVVINEAPSEFIEFIRKEVPGNADERIIIETIRIDGPLAFAWTPYKFYYKGKFTHCGVNSFQLVKFQGEWKIQYIIDTRRRTGCGE